MEIFGSSHHTWPADDLTHESGHAQRPLWRRLSVGHNPAPRIIVTAATTFDAGNMGSRFSLSRRDFVGGLATANVTHQRRSACDFVKYNQYNLLVLPREHLDEQARRGACILRVGRVSPL